MTHILPYAIVNLLQYKQSIMKSYVLLLCLLPAILAAEQPFKKVIHNTDPKARCLDGSPPALYIHQGNDPNRFIIFFNGGGSCIGASISDVIENCYQRSKTDLGSSKNLKEQITINGGYLSTDPQKSKFASWTKVVIQYCDGSFHQGNNQNSIRYKDAQLFMRGAYNTRSHFKYLIDKYNLANAEKVVLTGSSAGAIATYLWNNYVRGLLANPNAMVAVPDSGVFINVASPETGNYNVDVGMKTLFKVSNVDEKTPNPVCNRFKQDEEYKCMFIQTIFTSLTGNMLLVNSQYDSQAIPGILDIKCVKPGKTGSTLSACNTSELANIEVYRKAYLNFITNFMHFSKNSVWTISCSQHVYAVWGQFYDSEAQKVPGTSGLTVRDAVERFVLSGERISAIDGAKWPENAPCAY